MRAWFTCKVKYFKPIENTDKSTKVTESYLVAAHTFTEAEALITNQCESFIQGEFYVDGLTKNNLAEVIPFDDAEDWYKVKVSYLIEDESTGKESQKATFSLIQARSVKDAFDKMSNILSNAADRYVIPSIGITKIQEVFAYDDQETKLRAEGFVPVEEKSAPLPVSSSFDAPTEDEEELDPMD